MAKKNQNKTENQTEFGDYKPGDLINIPGLGDCVIKKRVDGRLEVYRESKTYEFKSTYIVDIP